MALGGRCDPTNTSYPGLYTTPIPQAFLNLFQGYLQVSQTVPRYYSDDCTRPFADPYIANPPPGSKHEPTATPTWMYLTADVVDYCNKQFPGPPGYFVDHALAGTMFWSATSPGKSANGIAAAPAVHIEADDDLGAVATAHPASGFPISFYHRFAVPVDGVSDYREPLPTAWSMRYEGIGTDFIGTSFLAWKGSTNYTKPYDMEPQGGMPLLTRRARRHQLSRLHLLRLGRG